MGNDLKVKKFLQDVSNTQGRAFNGNIRIHVGGNLVGATSASVHTVMIDSGCELRGDVTIDIRGDAEIDELLYKFADCIPELDQEVQIDESYDGVGVVTHTYDVPPASYTGEFSL